MATAAAKEVLCLPIFPELTNEEHERVCTEVRAFFGLGAPDETSL